MSRRVRRSLFGFVLTLELSLGLGMVGWGWGLEEYILGRDKINFDALGGDIMQAGEDLQFGEGDNLANRYPFKTTADTLRAYRSNSSDTGTLLVECINPAGAAVKDSVTLSAPAQAFSGPCVRALAVNMAEYHSASANVGSVRAYVNNAYNDSSSILANIPPQTNRALMAQYTVPRGKTLIPLSLRLSWALDSSADKYTRVGGVAAVKYRPSGQNWKVLDQLTFRPEQGAVFVAYPVDPQGEFSIPALSQLVVAMGVTGAATGANLDATARFQFDLR